jgi:acetyl-CoA carboxylase carboxyl transferase subunit alpha
MGVTSDRLSKLGLIDEIIAEPLGGAHRNPAAMAEAIKNAVLQALAEFESLSTAQLLQRRQNRWLSYGAFKES